MMSMSEDASCTEGMEVNEKESDLGEQNKTEPVAVVGFSLRFPGATSPEAFWQLMSERRSAMTEIPPDRFNIDAYYHPDPERLHTINCRGGHFVDGDIAAFDAPFFSIPPAEAACIDPQQRILLETTYTALENAGIPIESIAGTKTSVHVGAFSHDYEVMFARDTEGQAKYQAPGTGPAMLANRISWFFDLKGPSIALDTACSSSLNALYLACQNLRSGETTMGIVGGCNLILYPDTVSIPLGNMNFLSPTSRCYPFDADANGYSRGEGFGVLVLKLLSQAVNDGDTIRAVIRATGANQDGRTPGITQPNSDAQEILIRDVYDDAGLDLRSTLFFEAHGTGTQIGDSYEARAIGAVFKRYRSPDDPLFCGAVKSNIGHLEGASGMASVIKTILALEKGFIPPNIGYAQPNPLISVHDWNLEFPLKNTPWPNPGIRRASVNSFGYGGANTHVVLDDAYSYLNDRGIPGNHNTTISPLGLEQAESGSSSGKSSLLRAESYSLESHNCLASFEPKIFPFSAADEAGLLRLASTYSEHLSKLTSFRSEEIYLKKLAFTLSNKRSQLPWKACVFASSVNELRTQLAHGFSKPVRSTHPLSLGFIFTGQGAQWHGMGQELFRYPAFKKSIEEADLFLQTVGCAWSVTDALSKDKETSNLESPVTSQTLCTVLEIALLDLLASWNIVPSAVVGHSSGEIAAAYCIGGLSRESAWSVAYYRGLVAARLLENGEVSGAMMAVASTETAVAPFISKVISETRNQGIAVGCINSPKSLTVTGHQVCVDALKEMLEREKIFCKKLAVRVSYHSAEMELVASEYLSLMGQIRPRGDVLQSKVPVMFSSTTGEIVSADQVGRGEYWVRNMVSKVLFADALRLMCPLTTPDGWRLDGKQVADVNYLIEIGPQATLRRPVKETTGNIEYDSILREKTSALQTSFEMVERLYCRSHNINLSAVNKIDLAYPDRSMLVDLPQYPFNHLKTYWTESRLSKGIRFRKVPHHELLGTPSNDWNPLNPHWRNIIRRSENPWIDDHRSNGSTLYPAAGMVVMAIEAARQVADPIREIDGYHLKDFSFHRALLIAPDTAGTETQVRIHPSEVNTSSSSHAMDFHLYVYSNDEWAAVSQGIVIIRYKETRGAIDQGKEAEQLLHRCRKAYATGIKECKHRVESVERLYESAATSGYGFGPTFQTLEEVSYSRDGQASATVELCGWRKKSPPNSRKIQSHVIHPTALDGVFQGSVVALSLGGTKDTPTMIPTRIKDMWISNKLLGKLDGDKVTVHTKTILQGYREADFEILALDPVDEGPRITIAGYRVTALSTESAATPTWRRLCYEIARKPDLELLQPDKLSEICTAAVDVRRRISADSTATWELLCLYFMSKVNESFEDLGTVSKPYLKTYVKWARHHYAECRMSNIHNYADQIQALEQNESYKDELLELISTSGPEGRLFVTVGKNLPRLLRGEVDPLEFLFRDNLLQDFYTGSGFGASYDKIAAYTDLLAHKYPDMSILEIGAGTGGATDSILKTLEPRGSTRDHHGTRSFKHYTYTDISPSFFEDAQKRFNNHLELMSFQLLDIELDPSLQGFGEAKYDLIIASAVLHATSDIDNTLDNTRKLMRPGAKLLLLEPTNLSGSRIPFVFGLLPGWWLSTEPYRRGRPMLSREEWSKALERNGFDGVDLAIPDHADEHLHGLSVIVATASGETARTQDSNEVMVLYSKDSPLQNEIADNLVKELGVHGCTVYKSTTLDIVCFRDMKEFNSISLVEIEKPLLAMIDAESFESLKMIAESTKGMLWVSYGGGGKANDPETALVNGLSTTLRSEYPSLAWNTLALDRSSSIKDTVSTIATVFGKLRLVEPSYLETAHIEIDGCLCIDRAVEANKYNDHIYSQVAPRQIKMQTVGEQSGRALTLSIGSPGLLDTLRFEDNQETHQSLADDEVEIMVKASGVNFKDVMIAMGQLPERSLGQECAGIIARAGRETEFVPGNRVCCLVTGAYKTLVRSSASSVSLIPDDMPYQTAAALPVVFCTAFYALHHVARLRNGESILIHSAAGGVGQAAIQLAQLLDVEIFVTVGQEEKKELLMAQYNINEDHIFSSRNLSFASGIKRLTNGRGVDVVLNSLAGDFLKESWSCVAPVGRFVEIGKRDVETNESLPMAPFGQNLTFASVDLGIIASKAKPLMREVLKAVMALATGPDAKVTAPFPLHVYKGSQMEEAFRYLQSGRNTGKTIVEMHTEDMIPVLSSPKPSWLFDQNATYVITGGFGGIGRGIARWMQSRDAKHLILISRKGPQTDAALALVAELEAEGVQVAAPVCDVSDEEAVIATLAKCSEIMPPIKGCVHGAMALRDALFANMSVVDWHVALGPKVQGTWNLHKHLPLNLNFFILLSSAGAILGNRGQANYASGSTYQDAVARHRVSRGQKCMSINLGLMLSIGYAAERKGLTKSLEAAGHNGIRQVEFFAMLDYFCNPELPLPHPDKAQLVTGLSTPVSYRLKGLDEPLWMRRPFFRHLYLMDLVDVAAQPAHPGTKANVNYAGLLRNAPSVAAAGAIVAQALTQKLAKALFIPEEDVDAHKPVHSAGVDSLVAVEIRQWFATEMGADVPLFRIVSTESLKNLSFWAATQSKFVGERSENEVAESRS